MNETLANRREIDPLRLLEGSSSFKVSLLDSDEKLSDEGCVHDVHQSVLKPLLDASHECFVYGLQSESAVRNAVTDLLTKDGSRWRLKASEDSVTGREVFWNAYGGKRGTVLVVLEAEKFPVEVFSHCRWAWVTNNYRSAHTPAAIDAARRRVRQKRVVVACFPRNNGLEWIDLIAPHDLLQGLYSEALSRCGGFM